MKSPKVKNKIKMNLSPFLQFVVVLEVDDVAVAEYRNRLCSGKENVWNRFELV